MQELIGTRPSAAINLAAQIVMLAGLWLGFRFARARQIQRHANIQTGVGTGLLNYLSKVQDATEEQDIITLAETVREWLERIDAFAVSVRQAAEMTPVASAMAGPQALVFGVLSEGIVEIEARADAAGIRRSTVVTPTMPGPAGAERPRSSWSGSSMSRAPSRSPQGWIVEYINLDRPKHTVTFDDEAFKSGSMTQGDQTAKRFDSRGTTVEADRPLLTVQFTPPG